MEVPPVDGNGMFEPLVATLRAEWLPRNVKWFYSLLVGDIEVPPRWTKTGGVILTAVPPQIAMIPTGAHDDASDAGSSQPSGVPSSSSSTTLATFKTGDNHIEASSLDFLEERVEAVIDATKRELTACSQVCHIGVQKKRPRGATASTGMASILITADVLPGPLLPHNVGDIAKQALNTLATSLETVELVSMRIQREENTCTLKANVVCLPPGNEDKMCWDLLKKGSCKRRDQCRWYHPQASDTVRIKVILRRSGVKGSTKKGI